jgi:hypothetical protein
MDALIPVIIQIVKALTTIIKAVLPVLILMLTVVGKIFGVWAAIIGTVVGWVMQLIKWLGDLLRPVALVVDALSHLSIFGDLIHMVTGGGPSQATGGPGGTANFTFNIHGDPAVIEQTVVRALRDYTRRNGYTSLGLGPVR